MDPLMIAYASLGLLAVAPIYLGSFSSIPHPTNTSEKEVLSTEDAYWFPVIGSVVLFSFYLMFTFLSKEMVNLVITSYFAIFGAAAVYRLFVPGVRKIAHALTGYDATASHEMKSGSWVAWIVSPFEFRIERHGKVTYAGSIDLVDALTLSSSIAFTAYYVMTKNWIASNIFGEAFSVSAISLLHLDSFVTGSILLSGLFLYDIFWVFGTNVMVTVAKSFDAPIKVLFPKNIFAEKLEFALLGLGDIVIPGIFVALCLRFDHERAGKPESNAYAKPYFTACFIAYVLGLATTVTVMHTFKAAQPALLYLSPACILSVLLTALVRGELRTVYNFTTEKKEEAKKEPESKKTK